jgi:plastocyanin
LAILSLLALVAVAQPAAAGGGGSSPCSGFTRGATISMYDACFQGTAHIVEPGTTVTVTNYGQVAHNFTAVDGSFASGLLQPSQSFQVTLDEPGVIPFYCTLHGSAAGNGMAGVLFVGKPAASARASGTPTLAASVHGRSTVPSYLAAGALLMSSIALAVAIGRVHRRRRAAGASSSA